MQKQGRGLTVPAAKPAGGSYGMIELANTREALRRREVRGI
jgi:hypothetical protein